MHVRGQQHQHDNQEENFGAEQKAVKQIDQRCPHADHAAADERKEDSPRRRGDVRAKPVVDAGGDEFPGAADIGGGQGVHQEHHAKAGYPLAVASQIARRKRTQTGVGGHVLVNLKQQQGGVAHQRPERTQQQQGHAKSYARGCQGHCQHSCANRRSGDDKNTSQGSVSHAFLYNDA